MSRLIRWLVCECGKEHTAVGIGPDTLCTCDRRLWPQLWAHGRSTRASAQLAREAS